MAALFFDCLLGSPYWGAQGIVRTVCAKLSDRCTEKLSLCQ